MSNLSRRITALAMALAVVTLAAASGNWPQTASSEPSSALEAPATSNAPSEFVYFPAQYVNQATAPSEHIQAF